ncbi:unnamed protein product [Durusdinium trenchii]|uniref:Major facilitator superfamily (MFS) profile domain-containing protein n=2 Tax=Durusdinium trenchii TaxID=1381693 RepID=A0ABP0MLI1_9DINO
MSSAEHVVMSKSLTGERRRSGRIMHLLVYTMSTMVFGMICSALGPSIPWLASNADVTPETLGWLPAAQAVMCIVSGLASSLMAFVARKYHHLLLGLLLLWLGVFFMVLPLASSSIYALTLVFAFQVLPRPWIGQMTNLLVSELYEEPSLSSAAQSFNQGGFALGCVFMVMLEEISSSAFGGAAMFYIAGGFTGLSSLLFFTLPRAPEKAKVSGRSAKGAKGARESKMPSAFTLTCSCLGILAVGLEVACGTWLITSMTQMGFESSLASLCNIIFWLLFAVSRLVLAPCLCKCLKPRPSSMIIGGASLAALSCIAAVAWPRSLPAVLLGVSGIALGAGPSYAMTISMAKESVELTSVDSAMFAIASSLGAGGVPFVMSRVLNLFGPEAFFPSLLVMSAILMTLTRIVGGAKDAREVETKDAIESDMESMESTQANDANSDSAVSVASEGSAASASLESSEDGLVPPIMWTYWEQGWEDAPLLCQACAKSWEGMNPHLSLQKISGADLPDLLPELCYKTRFWELPAGQRSDLVRLSLLEKFGGLWVDATLFCTSPVMPWLSALKQADTSEGSSLSSSGTPKCGPMTPSWTASCRSAAGSL